MGAIVIIPTRWDSVRFPGKTLTPIGGKSLLQRCYESVVASGFTPIITAPDEIIRDEAKHIGAEFVLTSYACGNGTERVAQAANILGLSKDTILVNCQADMFGWEEDDVDFITRPIEKLKQGTITTVYSLPYPECDVSVPDVVKVFFKGFSFVYSREYNRQDAVFMGIHYGLYVGRKGDFDTYVKTPPTEQEQMEKLEQLRWQIPVCPVFVNCAPCKVDVPDDLPRCYEFLAKKQKGIPDDDTDT